MTPIYRLAELLDLPELAQFAARPDCWFTDRDAIKTTIARVIETKPTKDWLDLLVPHDIWCAKVMNWDELLCHPAFARLDMVQTVAGAKGVDISLMRAPLRLDGQRAPSVAAAPAIGQNTDAILDEFGLRPRAKQAVP